jgi:hypothetical protein
MKKFGELVLNYLKRQWWYYILLLLSSIYVFVYRNDIYELSKLNAKNLIFIIWLVLLLLPLLSEIEIFGVKIKKEIDEAKSEIRALGFQIADLKLSNNNSNVTNNYLAPLPSKEDIQKYSDRHVNQVNKEINPNEFDLSKDVEKMTSDISQQTIYLFQIRFMLEKLMLSLCEKVGYNSLPVMHKMLPVLLEHDLINEEDRDLINKIYRITSRGIHGEIISNDYINFVRSVYPDLHMRLANALNNKVKETYRQYNFSELQ